MRQRGLRDAKDDDGGFRHSRSRHEGVCVEMEYHQYCPHFFTRDRAALPIEGLYRGTSAFLICNGPSFATLDHNLLRKPGIMTFGINNGPRSFRPNFWTCVDDPVRFIKSIWLDPKIMKFVPQSHFEKKIFDNERWVPMDVKVGECPNVVGYCRNEKFHAPRFLTENSINWGNHKDFGGCRSVMLPALRILHLMGFRKVYLLGCDMKMAENYTYHFDEQRSKGAVSCNMGTYDRLKSEYLPELKPIFESDGYMVYNCNPESELKVFPFMKFEDAVQEATARLGDVEHERVYGMYSTPDEKNKWRQEPPQEAKRHLETLKLVKELKTTNLAAIPMRVDPPTDAQRAADLPIEQDEPETACGANDDQDANITTCLETKPPNK